MGVWNPHTNTGIVHYADYAQLPAKKIWSWGTDPDGLDWRKTLSDNNSAYVEVQAGLFRNQETYAFLEPRQTIRFSEFWMPVRDIGGISRANLTGSRPSRPAATSACCRTEREPGSSPGARFAFWLGDHEVFQREGGPPSTADLVTSTRKGRRPTEIHIRASRQQRVICFCGKPRANTIGRRPNKFEPARSLPSTSQTESIARKMTGSNWETNRNSTASSLMALQTYRDALARFPESMQLRKAAGRLCASLLRFEEAKTLLEPVEARRYHRC